MSLMNNVVLFVEGGALHGRTNMSSKRLCWSIGKCNVGTRLVTLDDGSIFIELKLNKGIKI